MLSDKNKRTIYDQVGEEGLKSGGAPPDAGPSGFGGFPSATSFTFTTSPGGGGFSPSDPERIFEYVSSHHPCFHTFQLALYREIFSASLGGMGGMGMGGRPSLSSGFGDGPASFFASMPGGMPRRTSQRATSAPAPQPSEITRPLKLSLEDLYSGSTKHLKVSRKLLDGSTEEKVLEVQILPGWKSGTKIRFPHAGNQQPSGESQDLVFIVEEKPHSVFTRDGDDLVCNSKIPLVDALTGGDTKKVVQLLDGRKVQVSLPLGVVKPGQETRVVDEGMPIRKQASPKTKGDLVIRWDVKFPDRLTPSQKEAIRRILT